MKLRISLAGDLGSGKSTVANVLLNRYESVKRISGGVIQRELAREMGMTIEQFNRYMETHPEFDKKLDEGIGKYKDIEGSFIFDSRLAWHFVPNAFSVYLKVDPTTAAKRVFEASRDDESYASVEEAFNRLKARRESEIMRYKSFYGLDITDMNNYDFCIDTTNLTPEEAASAIVEAYEKKCGKIS